MLYLLFLLLYCPSTHQIVAFCKPVKSSRAQVRRKCLYAVSRLRATWWRLHAGGGIGKARTRAKNDVTCSVSDETAPPLA